MKNKKKSFWNVLAIGCMSLIATASMGLGNLLPLKTESVVGSAATHYAEPSSVSATSAMKMYNPDLDTGFKLENAVSKTVYGSTAYTNLTVNSTNGTIKETSYNGVKAYAIDGSDVSIALSINHQAKVGSPIVSKSEWNLCNDSWGTTEGQLVNGVKTGTVDSGALLVQVSKDNKTYTTAGTVTTDYFNNFGKTQKTIYTPKGTDVNKGIYVRVLYAYEIVDFKECTHPTKFLGFLWETGKKHDNDNVFKNYVEAYTFFICNDDPEAVTFHNLSAKDSEELKGENGESIDYLTAAETLTDGSVTSTGFKIDQSLLPSSTVSLTRNGKAFEIPADNTITQDGCYDILVKTKLGRTKTTRIYVDTRDFEQIKAYYFGEGLLAGSKRIYDKGEIPVYEAGLTNYALQPVGDEYLPLGGYIKNFTTCTVIQIDSNREAKSGTLWEAGEYEVVLCNNPTFTTDNPVGDCQSILFKFKLIEEGTAPGPQLNQELLAQYMQSNVSDLKPFFYAVTQHSAGRGDITIAFSSYQKAYDYAYAQNVGLVEEMSDGSYRYFGHFVTQSKEKYESNFDLTAAINYFTEQSITKNYFDLSEKDGFSYTTLDEGLLDGRNLRALELASSVVVFASEEDRIALLQDAETPLIGLKKSAVLGDGIDAQVRQQVEDFVFLRDSLGIDSEQVTLLDFEGNAYKLEYGKGFAQQLIDYNLPTGRFIVVESTIYGDVTSYPIRFIAPNDNTATVTMSYSLNGEVFEQQFNQASTQEPVTIECNEFTLSLIDDMAISYLKVTKKGSFEEGFAAEDLAGLAFAEEGGYHIICVNILGYTFTFNVIVKAFVPVTINFSDCGLEGIDTYYSATNVLLPSMEKYGYNFAGWQDEEGNIYNEEIQQILFMTDTVLKPVWEAKKYFLSLHYTDGKVATEEVEFGTETTLPNAEEPNDYRFVGWYDEATDECVNDKFTLSVERNVVLQARFVKAYSNVTFELGMENYTAKYAVGATFYLPQPKRAGYIFQGWRMNGEAYTMDSYTVGDTDCTFQAVWVAEPVEEQPQVESTLKDANTRVPVKPDVTTNKKEKKAESGCAATIGISGVSSMMLVIGGVCCKMIFKKKEEK